MKRLLLLVGLCGCWTSAAPAAAPADPAVVAAPAAPVAEPGPSGVADGSAAAGPPVVSAGTPAGAEQHFGEQGHTLDAANVDDPPSWTRRARFADPAAQAAYDKQLDERQRARRGAPSQPQPIRPTAEVQLYGDPIVSAGLEVADVRRQVKRNFHKIQRCSDLAQASHPGLAGNVTARFTVDASGVPSQVTVFGVLELNDCITEVVQNLELPRPTTPSVDVRIALAFTYAYR